jgi:hypothetical protein
VLDQPGVHVGGPLWCAARMPRDAFHTAGDHGVTPSATMRPAAMAMACRPEAQKR